TDLGSDGTADLLSVDGLIARSRGRDTGVAWVSFGTSADSQPGSVRALFPLGGFLNLSGLAPDSISGRHFAIARLMYYRQIGRGGEGFLNVPAYAGLSLEAGNVWDRRSEISLGSARKQGSLFFGFDTLFGPVYLGTGFGEDRTAFYLFLGRTF
ncbi:MAG: patatin, partial [Nevskiaceae bacterium]